MSHKDDFKMRCIETMVKDRIVFETKTTALFLSDFLCFL